MMQIKRRITRARERIDPHATHQEMCRRMHARQPFEPIVKTAKILRLPNHLRHIGWFGLVREAEREVAHQAAGVVAQPALGASRGVGDGAEVGDVVLERAAPYAAATGAGRDDDVEAEGGDGSPVTVGDAGAV